MEPERTERETAEEAMDFAVIVSFDNKIIHVGKEVPSDFTPGDETVTVTGE